MCGIVAYIGPREAYPVVLKGLKRLEYRGYDSAGVAAASDVNGSALTKDTWPDVLSLKVYLVARSTEPVAGFTDTKSYPLGTAGDWTPGGSYRRHVFVQTVRLVNPMGRRTS